MKPASTVCAILVLEKILKDHKRFPQFTMFSQEIRDTIKLLEKQLDDCINGGGHEL